MNIIFAGTPEFAAVSLSGLLNAQHHISAILTQPDRPAGRGRKAQISAVKALAEKKNIPVLQPIKLDQDAFKDIAVFACDVMVVAAYGLIIPQFLLDWPKHGCINVHASLLPRWRGAAPIQRSIEAGDAQTGITIMQMDAGLDTGDMLGKERINILATDNAQTLHDKLANIGASLLVETLTQLELGRIDPNPQDNSKATYAKKISNVEGRISWHDSADIISKQVRAFTPWPSCFTFLQGERVKILQAKIDSEFSNKTLEPGQISGSSEAGLLVNTSNGILCIEKLQLAGKKPIDAKAVINGYPHWISDQLIFEHIT